MHDARSAAPHFASPRHAAPLAAPSRAAPLAAPSRAAPRCAVPGGSLRRAEMEAPPRRAHAQAYAVPTRRAAPRRARAAPAPSPRRARAEPAPSPHSAVGVLKGVGPCSEYLQRKGMTVSWKQSHGRKGCGALAYNMAIYLPSSRPWRIGRLEIMELCSLSTVARPWPARAWH